MHRNVSAVLFATVIAVGAIYLMLDERVSWSSITSSFSDTDHNPPN